MSGPLRARHRRRVSRCVPSLLLALAPLLAGSPLVAQETATVFGQVVDHITLLPIADVFVHTDGTEGRLQALTDQEGRFRITDVPIGEVALVVQHVAYGEYTTHIVVGRGDFRVDVRVSPEAIELDPIVVRVLTDRERSRLASGSAIREVDASEIAQAARQGAVLQDVLRQLPGVRVKAGSRGPMNTCVEYRGGGSPGPTGCRELANVLDGVLVTSPGLLYSTMMLEDIDRMEVMSPIDATWRFGEKAGYGALLIESRQPELPTIEAPRVRAHGRFDAALEEEPYNWMKVLGSTFVANAIGLGLGMTVATQCIEAGYAPGEFSLRTKCDMGFTVGSSLIAAGLPVVATTFASRTVGATDMSRGRLLASSFVGTLSVSAGYVWLLRSKSEPGRDLANAVGIAILTVGTPIAVTVADYMYRTLR